MTELPRVLVVMALAVESAGVFEGANIPVLYCGVGKVNAAATLMRELCRYAERSQPPPLVLNFGSAGSRVHATGALVACHEFVQRDMDVTGLGFELGVTPYDAAPARLVFEPRFVHLPAALCGSGDSFAMSACLIESEVVDMEAYALAKACWLQGASFACAKYVTDGADHAAADHWRDNVHKAAEAFLELYRAVGHDAGARTLPQKP
jgi:adenosylhomocysteine nucleosidase